MYVFSHSLISVRVRVYIILLINELRLVQQKKQ